MKSLLADNPCSKCKDNCCNHVSWGIPTPRSKKDFDELRWCLHHENVEVYKDKTGWYLLFKTPCTKLKDGLCSIYKDRPKICSDYPSPGHDCEGSSRSKDGKLCIKNVKELDNYLANRKVRPCKRSEP